MHTYFVMDFGWQFFSLPNNKLTCWKMTFPDFSELKYVSKRKTISNYIKFFLWNLWLKLDLMVCTGVDTKLPPKLQYNILWNAAGWWTLWNSSKFPAYMSKDHTPQGRRNVAYFDGPKLVWLKLTKSDKSVKFAKLGKAK